jgi:hypothetical protein
MSGLNSFRGIAKTFEILSIDWANPGMERLSQDSPNFNTIRQWVLRLGLHELNRTKEDRADWIFILDMTIEIGKNKCLVILLPFHRKNIDRMKGEKLTQSQK